MPGSRAKSYVLAKTGSARISSIGRDKSSATRKESPAESILQLQRRLGNQGMQRMLTALVLQSDRGLQAGPERALGQPVADSQGGNRDAVVQAQFPLQKETGETASESEAAEHAIQLEEAHDQRIPNRTGLPDQLKAGVESLSGMSLDDVKVHYNSDKPAQLDALAYAQGTDIHLSPGQEEHLPHEVWHIVQQKQGRVKPTIQMKGLPVNDDEGLEHEADAIGTRVLLNGALPASTSAAQRELDGHSPIQCTKRNAEAFIKAKSLDIAAEYKAVDTYVNNSSHPKDLRRGLLRAWNAKQLAVNLIAVPADLQESSEDVAMMDDLSGWNSEDEDEWDLGKIKEMHAKGEIDLERSGERASEAGVSEMGFLEAIRFGRQVVKRGDYSQLPIVARLGENLFEFKNPGTPDVYATPLEEVGQESKSEESGPVRRKYKRAGKSSDFNWKNLAGNLGRREREKEKRRSKIRSMLRFFLKGKVEDLDPAMAEAIAAIACDFMKGSRGGRAHLHRALAKVDLREEDLSFEDVFSGKTPIYAPAAVGGRALVRSEHEQVQIDANKLLNVDNCLINAIALASLGRRSEIGELIRIREGLQNYDEMLVASPALIGLIRHVLGIKNPIRIVYAEPTPAEDFPGDGELVTIYHVKDNDFRHKKPPA